MRRKKQDNNEPLTQEQFAQLVQVRNSPIELAKYVSVVHPIKGRVPFDLYPYQKSVLLNFMFYRFNIVLKFRQGGLTELICLYCLWLAMYFPNRNILILSIKDRVAKRVLKRIKFMYKSLPDFLKIKVANSKGEAIGTASELEFSNGSVIVSIPTTEDAGRSEPASLVVIDEAAIIKNAGKIWASIFPTLSTGGCGILNSCITGDTKIITNKGLLQVKDICPKKFGAIDLSLISDTKVLTHEGEWKRIIASVNKGKLETWKIKTRFGTTLKCTPNHKLYTPEGWMTVDDIVKGNKDVILFRSGLSELVNPPAISVPKKEIFSIIDGFPNYKVSNYGKVYYLTSSGWVEKNLKPNKMGYVRVILHNHKVTKHFTIHELVSKYFNHKLPNKDEVIDHIDCHTDHNWATNLRVISKKENTQRANLYSYGLKLGTRVGKSFTNIKALVAVKLAIRSGALSKGDVITFLKNNPGIFEDMSLASKRSYISKILSGKRGNSIELSKIKVVKKFRATIYDITVEDHHSYVTYNYNDRCKEEYNFINKNTPFGTGNFYHQTWVQAMSGSNGFNPIRLYREMHPDYDDAWYEQMRRSLGPRRTAQEIDGDFLSSGNTVFDLIDIKDIEESLVDYPNLDWKSDPRFKKLIPMGEALRVYKLPIKNHKYFIGADISSGRSMDYSTLSVMDRKGEEFASFRGKIPPKRMARLLYQLGKIYNWAIVAPESNDIGLSTAEKLQEMNYTHLYYSRKLLKKKGDNKPVEDKIPGWYTTRSNRSVIISNLEEDVRLNNVIIKDPFFVQEGYTFIYDSNNRPVAMGKHSRSSSDDEDDSEVFTDDTILAKAITNHIRKGPRNTVIIAPK